MFTNEGKGRGVIKKNARFLYDKVDAYKNLQHHPQFEKHVRMSCTMFHQLIKDLEPYRQRVTHLSKVKYVSKFFNH